MCKVLICDDTAFMRLIMRELVEQAGMEVVSEAANGQEAIVNYMKFKPDLVTMDITMPELDGLAALKKIMSIDQNAKIIMCSALGQQRMVVEALQHGAKDFIVKPVQKDRVSEMFQRILKTGS